MKHTDFSKIVTDIMNAKPPKGSNAYTYEMIEKKTGIGASTLSRLVTGKYKNVSYDNGTKLIALHNELKAKGKLQK